MGVTAAPWSLPYPDLSDPDNVPADIQELADRLNIVLPTLQLVSEKGAASGYASLDATGKIPVVQLPAAGGGTTVLRKTTLTDVVNTAAMTDLLNAEITIPANALSATGRVRLIAGGDYLNNSGAAKGIRLRTRLGGTAMWDATSSAAALVSDANRCAWYLEMIIQALGATNAQRAAGLFTLGYANQAAAATGVGAIGAASPIIAAPFLGAQTALAMTAAQALTFDVGHSAAHASTSMRLAFAYVDVN